MIMLSPSPPDTSIISSSNSVKNLFHGILSYDSNIMLAAIISLLLVILFVLLLHVYAKWFLVNARQRSTRRSVSVPQVLVGTRFHHFHSLTSFADQSPSTKGLESWVISGIPLFVYRVNDHHNNNNNYYYNKFKHGLMECAICLSVFEDEEVGRMLPKCNHSFHVECIDMWLHSHSTCPICRAPVVSSSQISDSTSMSNDEVILNSDQNQETSYVFQEEMSDQDSVLEIIVEVPALENENLSLKDSVSICSLSPSSVSSHHRPFHGDSIKKTTTKNRSECKVHPSTSVNESDF